MMTSCELRAYGHQWYVNTTLGLKWRLCKLTLHTLDICYLIPHTGRSVSAQDNLVNLIDLTKQNGSSTYEFDWPTIFPANKNKKRTDIPILLRFQDGLCLSIPLQVKFYDSENEQHLRWGQQLHFIDYDCKIKPEMCSIVIDKTGFYWMLSVGLNDFACSATCWYFIWASIALIKLISWLQEENSIKTNQGFARCSISTNEFMNSTRKTFQKAQCNAMQCDAMQPFWLIAACWPDETCANFDDSVEKYKIIYFRKLWDINSLFYMYARYIKVRQRRAIIVIAPTS